MAQENKLRRIMHRIWRYIRGNHPVTRVAALILALFLWVLITITQNPVRNTSYTIGFGQINLQAGTMLERDLIVVDDLAEMLSGGVTVYFQVEQKNFGELTPDKIDVWIDFTGIQDEDKVTLKINADAGAVDTAKVVRIEPSSVTVSIEKKETKRLRVDIEPQGQPPEGFAAGEPSIINDGWTGAIEIKGPKSIVSTVASARAIVDIEGATEAVYQSPDYELFDAAGQLIQSKRIERSHDNVEVRVPVYAYRVVPIAPADLYTGIPARDYQVQGTIQASHESITVFAPAEAIDEACSFNLIKVDITDETESKTGTVDIPQPSEGYTMPKQIQVVIPIQEDSRWRYYYDHEIEVIDLPPGFKAQVTPESVTVRVYGHKSTVNLIEPKNVRVFIDLGQYIAGGAFDKQDYLNGIQLQCAFEGVETAGISEVTFEYDNTTIETVGVTIAKE